MNKGPLFVRHFSGLFLCSISVILYKCHVGRGDCNFCHVADAQLNCGWCKSNRQCAVRDSCKSGWIERHLSCNTVPNITKVKQMLAVLGKLD